MSTNISKKKREDLPKPTKKGLSTFQMCDFILGIKKASVRSRNASYAGFALAIAYKLCSNNVFKLSPYVVTAFSHFSLFSYCRRYGSPQPALPQPAINHGTT